MTRYILSISIFIIKINVLREFPVPASAPAMVKKDLLGGLFFASFYCNANSILPVHHVDVKTQPARKGSVHFFKHVFAAVITGAECSHFFQEQFIDDLMRL